MRARHSRFLAIASLSTRGLVFRLKPEATTVTSQTSGASLKNGAGFVPRRGAQRAGARRLKPSPSA